MTWWQALIAFSTGYLLSTLSRWPFQHQLTRAQLERAKREREGRDG